MRRAIAPDLVNLGEMGTAEVRQFKYLSLSQFVALTRGAGQCGMVVGGAAVMQTVALVKQYLSFRPQIPA
jgi:hypothetical protein